MLPLRVLIVPFMELKQPCKKNAKNLLESLNRTFYGIETRIEADNLEVGKVLIVPFMELKL